MLYQFIVSLDFFLGGFFFWCLGYAPFLRGRKYHFGILSPLQINFFGCPLAPALRFSQTLLCQVAHSANKTLDLVMYLLKTSHLDLLHQLLSRLLNNLFCQHVSRCSLFNFPDINFGHPLLVRLKFGSFLFSRSYYVEPLFKLLIEPTRLRVCCASAIGLVT